MTSLRKVVRLTRMVRWSQMTCCWCRPVMGMFGEQRQGNAFLVFEMAAEDE